MYYEHFGLTEPPFRITPHTEFYFAGANRGATLDALIYAIISDEGIVKLSGEVGSGKTMLCRVLMERLPPHVAIVYLANPSLSKEDIVFAIAEELGLAVSETARASTVIRALQTRLIELHGAGKQVVVLIDEAHAMPLETLEEIRLLSNLETSQHKLLQLVLFGQPELDAVLARPDMRQLRERITHNFLLEPLHRDDVAKYIDFRMRAAGYHGPDVFSGNALKLIATASQGLTRRINILADKSLLATYAEGLHQVTPKQVDAAIRDAQYENPARGVRQRLAMGLGAAAALVFAAIGLTSWNDAETTKPVATPPAGAPAAPAQSTAAPTPPTAGGSPSTSAPTGAPSQPVAPPPPSSAGAAPAMPTPAEATDPASARPLATGGAPPPLTLALRERIAATRQWIDSAAADRWFIQLTAGSASEMAGVGGYLARADQLLQPERVGVYLAHSGSEARVGVIYGDFPSRKAASQAIEQLPDELRRQRPFARKVAWLK